MLFILLAGGLNELAEQRGLLGGRGLALARHLELVVVGGASVPLLNLDDHVLKVAVSVSVLAAKEEGARRVVSQHGHGNLHYSTLGIGEGVVPDIDLMTVVSARSVKCSIDNPLPRIMHVALVATNVAVGTVLGPNEDGLVQVKALQEKGSVASGKDKVLHSETLSSSRRNLTRRIYVPPSLAL